MQQRCLTSVAIIAALVGTTGAAAQSQPAAPWRPVVLISIDGFKPEYVQRADARRAA